MRIIRSLFITLISVTSLSAEEPTREELTKELGALFKAPYEKNFELLKKHAHPGIFKMVGGEEKYKELMTAFFKKTADSGRTLKSYDISAPKGYVATETVECFYAEAKLTTTTNKVDKVVNIIQFAIKPKDGNTWYYTNITKNPNTTTLRKHIPELPESFKLPVNLKLPLELRLPNIEEPEEKQKIEPKAEK